MPQPTAKQILHEVFGYPEFRGKQEAIVNALAGGESLMVLMPTGGGQVFVLPDSGADARRRGGCRIAADCADERPSGQPACGRD